MNISMIDHHDCTGCSVCSVVCPVNAITMVRELDGFDYPLINEDKCIKCKKCLSVCHTKQSNFIWGKGNIYAGHLLNHDVLAMSSSGGAASVIAESTISKGGCVYGVIYKDDFKGAQYYCINKIEDIKLLRGSKYIQSEPPDYNQIKDKLEKGDRVTFIGLPCQVDALYFFLGKSYSNLLLVSLVCHGPTSPIVIEKYLEELEKPNNSIKEFRFRYKKRGFTRPSRIYIKRENGKTEIKPFITSSFGMAFEILNRESCSFCKSKFPYGVADIIIGDFWGGKDKQSKQSEYGESLVIIRNPQKEFLKEELMSLGFLIEKAEWEDLEKKNPALFTPVKCNANRSQFVHDLQTMPLKEAVNRNISRKEVAINYIYYWSRALVPNKIWQRFRR